MKILRERINMSINEGDPIQGNFGAIAFNCKAAEKNREKFGLPPPLSKMQNPSKYILPFVKCFGFLEPGLLYSL